MKSINSKKKLIILLLVIAVYYFLFEFILPLNRILPKPSLLIESYSSLWNDYNLFSAFLVSASAVYTSIIVGYLIVNFTSGFWISTFIKNEKLLVPFKIFRYFPAFFYAVIFAFWFPESIIAEYFFGLIAAVFYFVLTIKNELPNVKIEYIDSAKSLSISESKINSIVLWKIIQPNVYDSISKLHYYIWVLVLIFEFIGKISGFGGIYNSLLTYNDFAALFALAIFISIIIFAGNSFINFFKNKIIYWRQ
ncbi:MAG: hypothetical protein KJ571_15015 [Bacteroidetes bacterium]|nr:hypothetical protein [Bacteroidota bacterium]